MDDSKIKEELSISYISSVAAIAGIDYEISRHDGDSTDGLLKKEIILDNGKKFGSLLRIQLKCTSSTSQYTDNGEIITYKLKVKNYNDLCREATTPIILGLLIIPENKDDWVHWTTEDILIKGCMYWLSLLNNTESMNEGTVTVKIDKRNVINNQTLIELLKKVAMEEDL